MHGKGRDIVTLRRVGTDYRYDPLDDTGVFGRACKGSFRDKLYRI
ncbi:hypothetical protein [Robbsia andropogonis]